MHNDDFINALLICKGTISCTFGHIVFFIFSSISWPSSIFYFWYCELEGMEWWLENGRRSGNIKKSLDWMEMVALHIKSAFMKSLFCTVFILLAIKVSLYLLKTACQKDLEKSLKSKCLTRTLKKKSYYMNFKHKN